MLWEFLRGSVGQIYTFGKTKLILLSCTFLQSAFKNQLEKVRLSLGCELGPSQDQKDVLAVSFLNQQFVAKMQGTVAEEAREGREGYLLSRLCQ